jgi:hypothetical protein
LKIYDHATDILEERSENKVKQFDEARFYRIGDALEVLACSILTILSRCDLAGHRDTSQARAVSQVSASALALVPAGSPWDESDEKYYRRGRHGRARASG